MSLFWRGSLLSAVGFPPRDSGSECDGRAAPGGESRLRPGSLCGRFRICTREGRSSGPGDCRLLRRSAQTVQHDPGVRSASLSEDSPSEAGTGLPLGVSGAPPNDANRILPIGLAFFTTMQIPILTGRDIEERDRPGSPAAAIVGISRNARYGGLTSDIPPVA